MTTIEMTIEVGEQGTATIQLPADLKPGIHRVLVTVLDGPERPATRSPLTFSAHDVGPWPEGFTVRREEIYGDDGR
jgi:hypothetical protein